MIEYTHCLTGGRNLPLLGIFVQKGRSLSCLNPRSLDTLNLHKAYELSVRLHFLIDQTGSASTQPMTTYNV